MIWWVMVASVAGGIAGARNNVLAAENAAKTGFPLAYNTASYAG